MRVGRQASQRRRGRPGAARRDPTGAPSRESLPLVQTGSGSIDRAVLRRPPLPLHAFRAVLEGEVGPDLNHDPHRPVRAIIEASGSGSHEDGIPPKSWAVRAHPHPSLTKRWWRSSRPFGLREDDGTGGGTLGGVALGQGPQLGQGLGAQAPALDLGPLVRGGRQDRRSRLHGSDSAKCRAFRPGPNGR